MAMMLRNALKPVTFTLGAKVTSVDGHSVVYETSGGEKGAVEADVILMSVGERPTPKAGAQDAGLEIKNRAVATDANQRTTFPACGQSPTSRGRASSPTPRTAMAEVAAADILRLPQGRTQRPGVRARDRPLGLFSLPEAAGVGYTEDEAKAKG